MTAVTGTISPAWAGGSYLAQFAGQPGYQYSLSGGGSFPTSYSGSIGAGGVFSANVTDNNSISPLGSQWRFYCSAPFATPTFDVQATITGASQDISGLLQAAAPAIQQVIPHPAPGTATLHPFPPDQFRAGLANGDQIQLIVSGVQGQKLPLAAFTDYRGYVGMAITTGGLMFPDGSVQTSAAPAFGTLAGQSWPAQSAGVNLFTVTVPAGVSWILKSLYVRVNTSATVANRIVQVFIQGPTAAPLAQMFMDTCEFNQTAGQLINYTWARLLGTNQGAIIANWSVSRSLPDLRLGPGGTINFQVTGMAATDTFDIIQISYEQYSYPP